ncbi:MAG TPA: UDP-N-acetylmuramate dehydrogenase [bacterium]|nr:UDP-N-acetylmuramate dehydrogenase [bacterium]
MNSVFEMIGGIAGVATREHELLSGHTTFGVGGPCDLMVWVSTKQALQELLALARNEGLPLFILGKGSNLLVRDGGIPGVVVRLVDEFARTEVRGTEIEAGGGASLGDVVSKATSAGIGGLEFLAGIPGTVGGAAVSNAGAKDDWLSDRLVGLAVIDGSLSCRDLRPKQVGFGYRTSGIASDWIVTGAVLKGHAASVEEARQQVEVYLERRRRSQPIGEHSAGCVFKNPPGDYAGRLIEAAGLKGRAVGQAQVSPIHANFIVNVGGATAREILELIEIIRERVREEHRLDLELEINIVGKD